MEALKCWKRTLLQWVKGCNFSDKVFYNLEQTEIEAFFEEFKNRIKGNNFSNVDLSSFLNEHYPDFEPHFDDEKALSSNDYLYVYSLLLHFSCVKCGEDFFQKQCQKLNESAQQNITTFLKKLLETNSFTKDNIRHTIASISILLPQRTCLPSRDSPIKTPLKTEISPPTPRSNLIQEKNKELHSLKVQLENEMYEKNLLELEIKQNQDKITKLSQELKNSKQTVLDLRNELLSKSSYSDSEEKCSENKEMNRKLRKKLSQRESEIAQQRESIDALMEEKNIINEKLKLAETKIKAFHNRNEELTIKIDDLTDELERKDYAIQLLSESKSELEHYISEMRSSSASSRPDLNISVECLDLSRTTNSSDSVNSPENLGCSVIDLHLREKENENTKLRDEIGLLRLDNASLSKQMMDLTMRYSKLFEICNENLIIDQVAGPIENFIVFSNYIQEIAHKYEKQCSLNKELSVNNNALQEHNLQLCNKVHQCEQEIKNVDKKLTTLQTANQSLLSCRKKLESDLETIRAESIELQKENNSQLTLLKESQARVKQYENENREFLAKINKMNTNFQDNIERLKENHSSEISLLKLEIKDLELSKEKEKENNDCCVVSVKREYLIVEETLKELLNENAIQLKEKCELVIRAEKERDVLAQELCRTQEMLNTLLTERNICGTEIETYKTEIEALKSVSKKNEEAVQRLIHDSNTQTITIKRLQIEKETLISNILEKLAVFQIYLDKHDKSLEADIKAKNAHETETILLKNKLHDVSHEYMTIKDNHVKQTECISYLVDELKTLFASESNEGYEGTTQDFNVVHALKFYIDKVRKKLQEQIAESLKKDEDIKELTENVQLLTHNKKSLEHSVVVCETRIREMQEDFESELQCEKNKLINELEKLNGDLKKLSDVCDHLTEENLTLQSKFSDLKISKEGIVEENKLLKVRVSVLESERLNQLNFADQLINTQTELERQVTNMQTCVQKLETEIESARKLLSVKTRDAEALLEKHHTAENTIESLRKLVTELQSKTIVLENEVIDKEKIKEELKNANVYINKLIEQRSLLEDKSEQLEVQIEQLKNDLASMNSELLKLQYERKGLMGEIEFMKKSTFSNECYMEKCKKEMTEQKDNVSRLIKEVASIRKEKEMIEEGKNIIALQLEQNTDKYAILQDNYKNVVEKLELAEKDIKKQTKLKSEQLKKLQTEKEKLEENVNNNAKRIEKQALELGETQANLLKFKKEAETAQSNLEILKASSEALQRKNIELGLECKSYKEQLLTCDKNYVQLENKVKALEKLNEALRQEKENVESSEKDLKSLKETLEKNKANLEEKVRKLAKSLNESSLAINRQEQDKVSLNLEIGGLNKQLEENRSLLNMRLKENQELKTDIIDVKNENSKLIELNNKYQVEANQIREENDRLTDQLSKLSLRLKIAQEEYETTRNELDALRADIEINKSEKDTIKKDYLVTVGRLKEIEEFVEEQQTVKSEFLEKISLLNAQIEQITAELNISHETLKQEKQVNEKLNTDISILQAKLQKSRLTCEENEKRWNEEKEHLIAEVKASDERIKETRLELEGKLEKMKNKMKTLYNDEITKMKKKQERELAVLKSEYDNFKTQNEKLEEHTKKLSSQIFRLNENILEYQKQNTFLKTKIKDLESKSYPVSRTANTIAAQSSARQCLGSNLHMEDEEGEVFNNTYLSDLKSGRISEMFCKDICAQELQYRNSLLPPHLKSTYLAQFDHQMGEDEIRETPTLDDSSSTLLNTGHRKKVSGATSYKRPGPPTPSKNAGRLSFGGIGEPSREILKETDVGNVQCAKTPAKFKLFSSRLSMSKDENSPPNKRRLSNLFKKK